MLRLFVICLLSLLGVSGSLAQTPGAPEPYRLGVGDRINLRVVVWQEEQRAFQLWSAVNGDYKIQTEGSVTVPLAGTFQAAGRTTADLAETIASALEVRLGSVERPSTVVEVVEYSPFYVVGAVERSGAYPAEPGLTALQAYALAGGPARQRADGLGDMTAALRDTGTLLQTQLELLRARIASVRLAAEVARRDKLSFPADLRHPDGPEALAALLDEEHQIFRSRWTAIEREESSLRELIALLEAEVAALQTKIVGQQTQLASATTNLENVTSLFERGLARSQQLSEGQRALFDLEAKGLDLQNGAFRAQQRIKEAERDLVGLSSNRATQAAVELQDVNAKIEVLRSRIDTLRQVILEHGAEIASGEIADQTVTTYHIQRGSGETRQDLTDPNALLLPGDILTVTRTLFSLDGAQPPGYGR